MRHLRYSRLLCLGALLGVASCLELSAPAPSALKVEMTLNSTSLRSTDTPIVTVTATNTSERTILVDVSPCFPYLDARNQRNEPVNFGDVRYCAAIKYSPKPLAPGETWVGTLPIVHPLPGEYRLRAGIPSAEAGGFVFSPDTTVAVAP